MNVKSYAYYSTDEAFNFLKEMVDLIKEWTNCRLIGYTKLSVMKLPLPNVSWDLFSEREWSSHILVYHRSTGQLVPESK